MTVPGSWSIPRSYQLEKKAEAGHSQKKCSGLTDCITFSSRGMSHGEDELADENGIINNKLNYA